MIAKTDSQVKSSVLPQKVRRRLIWRRRSCRFQQVRLPSDAGDGSLQLWDLPPSRSNQGPTLRSVFTLPSRAGVLSLVKIEEGLVLSSHDQGSLALWTQTEGGFALRSIVEFPSQLGAVTSGALVSVGTQKVLLIGHESGFVSLWQKTRWSPAWLGQTDVRSPSPVP